MICGAKWKRDITQTQDKLQMKLVNVILPRPKTSDNNLEHGLMFFFKIHSFGYCRVLGVHQGFQN